MPRIPTLSELKQGVHLEFDEKFALLSIAGRIKTKYRSKVLDKLVKKEILDENYKITDFGHIVLHQLDTNPNKRHKLW